MLAPPVGVMAAANAGYRLPDQQADNQPADSTLRKTNRFVSLHRLDP
jgi:hypothetical protein